MHYQRESDKLVGTAFTSVNTIDAFSFNVYTPKSLISVKSNGSANFSIFALADLIIKGFGNTSMSAGVASETSGVIALTATFKLDIGFLVTSVYTFLLIPAVSTVVPVKSGVIELTTVSKLEIGLALVSVFTFSLILATSTFTLVKSDVIVPTETFTSFTGSLAASS